MASPEEIAYQESMRSLDGQARDLASVRAHVSIALSAAGIAAAFLGAQADGRGPASWIAAATFALLALVTVLVYRPVDFPWGFDGHKLVTEYVDAKPQPAGVRDVGARRPRSQLPGQSKDAREAGRLAHRRWRGDAHTQPERREQMATVV